MTPKSKYITSGKTYELIQFESPFALYKESDKEHYELLKLRVYKKDHVFPTGHKINAGDIEYPSINEWGVFGWSFISKESALNKLSKLQSDNPSECPFLMWSSGLKSL
jgi:hypothetical protein